MTPAKSLRIVWIVLALALLCGWYLAGSPGVALFRPHASDEARELDRRGRAVGAPTPSLSPRNPVGSGRWPSRDVANAVPRPIEWVEALRRFDGRLARGARPDDDDRAIWNGLDADRLADLRQALGSEPSPTLFLLVGDREDLGPPGQELRKTLLTFLAQRVNDPADTNPRLTEELLGVLPSRAAGAFLEEHWDPLEHRWLRDPKLPRSLLVRVGTRALLPRLRGAMERVGNDFTMALTWLEIATAIEERDRDTAFWQDVLVPEVRRLLARAIETMQGDELLGKILDARAQLERRLRGDLLFDDLVAAEPDSRRETVLLRLLKDLPPEQFSTEVRRRLSQNPRWR